MCILCVDAEDMLDPEDRRDSKMAEPWEALRDAILATLEEGIQAFSVDLKESVHGFLKDVAVKAAQEKWRSLNAATPEEKQVAESNLRHLQGQVGAEIARLKLVNTARAKNLLEKVVSTALGILIRVAPALMG